MPVKEDKMVTTYQPDYGDKVILSAKNVLILKSGDGQPTVDEITRFITFCKSYRLNPYIREVYLIKYSARAPASIVVGKDAYNRRAVEHADYNGHEAGIIVQLPGAEPKIERRIGTFKLQEETLLGGWCRVYRHSWDHPVEIEVSLDEYLQLKDGKPMASWGSKPSTMICKVAKVQCWREAFPGLLGNALDESEVRFDRPVGEEVSGSKYQIETEEPEKEKTPEQIELEKKILEKFKDPDFHGTVLVNKKPVSLENVVAKVRKDFETKTVSLDKLKIFEEEIDMLTMLAHERDAQTTKTEPKQEEFPINEKE